MPSRQFTCVASSRSAFDRSHFPSAPAGSQGRRPGLTQDFFVPQETWEGSERVQAAPTRTHCLGQKKGRDTSSSTRGQSQLCSLLRRQPDLLPTHPGATLSLSTRPGSLSDLSSPAGDPVQPPPQPPVTSEARRLLCVVPCLYFRHLWDCRVPALTVPSPNRACPLLMTDVPSLPPVRGSLVARSLTRAGLGVQRRWRPQLPSIASPARASSEPKLVTEK